MKVKIIETGEVTELKAADPVSGCDWSQDLIGNAGAIIDGQFSWPEEAGAYLVDQETFDWWQEYIEASERTDREAEELAEELGIELGAITNDIAAMQGGDYGDHREQAKHVMSNYRAGYFSVYRKHIEEMLDGWDIGYASDDFLTVSTKNLHAMSNEINSANICLENPADVEKLAEIVNKYQGL